jgi:ParB/RepB/Spo0J family partition protein
MPKALRARAPVVEREAARREALQQIDQARHGQLLVLDPTQIEPNPRNPRQVFGEPEINALAESLKADGQLQPVVVRRIGERFQLIAGERRWRAAQRAGLSSIEAKVRDVDDGEALRLSIVENFHRVDLSVPETVAALDDLAEMAGQMGLRAAARLINTAPSWLSERLNVRADPVVFPALEAGRVSLGQATELRRAPAHARRTLLDRLLRTKPNTDQLHTWVREIKDADRHDRAEAVAALAVAPDRPGPRSERPYRALIQQLQALGAPNTRAERQALQDLSVLVQQLLANVPGDRRARTAFEATPLRNQKGASTARRPSTVSHTRKRPA